MGFGASIFVRLVIFTLLMVARIFECSPSLCSFTVRIAAKGCLPPIVVELQGRNRSFPSY